MEGRMNGLPEWAYIFVGNFAKNWGSESMQILRKMFLPKSYWNFLSVLIFQNCKISESDIDTNVLCFLLDWELLKNVSA